MDRLREEPVKEYMEKSFFALGTLNIIRVFDRSDEDLLDLCAQRVLQVDDLMSAFKPQSDIARLNQNAGAGSVEMHEDTFGLLRRSLMFSELSDGAFDITVRPLTELWSVGKKGDHIPSDEEILRTKKSVDYKNLALDEKTHRAALKDAGQAVDLGGIAKGYAAEEVKDILLRHGVKSALINLGGNILTIGAGPEGHPWKSGIQNPIAPTGQYLGVINAVGKTIVTSGSNERFFIKDGIRYHHILDPRTGFPAQTGLLSVTAICDCSTDADALTTSIFVLGPERGMALASMFSAEVVFVTENYEVIASNGLKDTFRLLNSNEM
jgi:FAD:protein FMN transferase